MKTRKWIRRKKQPNFVQEKLIFKECWYIMFLSSFLCVEFLFCRICKYLPHDSSTSYLFASHPLEVSDKYAMFFFFTGDVGEELLFIYYCISTGNVNAAKVFKRAVL